MPLKIINPFNNQPLGLVGDSLVDDEGTCFPLIKGAFRFVGLENYTNNFGLQWHVFRKTQLDHEFGAKELKSSTAPVDYIRLNIFPDGGISRLRIWGRPSK
jgi:hypothetical protein